MTGRGVRAADTAKDRRKGSGHRVCFEAMVAVGGAEGGAAFEAESVDVSSEGMRLRTAYLPQVGDRLVCRFDGPGTEVVAVGEVTWATEQSRGGEFGLRFVDLDEETELALKELCAFDGDEEVPAEDVVPAKPSVAKNARVKLHIEGLASPMKARVRDSDDREVCVGSSLEFLKLGRQVEVEDVDAGERRDGFVDAVKVEVDPATSVPQLVVSLRFDAIAVGRSPSVPAPSRAAAEAEEAAPITKVAIAPTSKRTDEAPRPSKAPKKEPKPVETRVSSKASADEASAEDAPVDDDDDASGAPNKLRAAQDKARDLTTKAAASIGPAFSKMGESARGFLTSIKGSLDKRREARDEAKKASAPRRVTAAAPGGALTSEGRRVVRQDASEKDEQEEAPPSTPKRSKKGVVMGAAAGLALVLGVVGISQALEDDTEESTAAAVATVDARDANAFAIPPIPGAPATADIPLYGPTPLSTTEQVIVPSSQDGKKADASEDDGGSEASDDKTELVREWGDGSVKKGKKLTVRMNGPIAGFSPTESEDGFAIFVPKVQSKSTSSALVRKDKRLDAVDVENREDGSEIRLKFKGDLPRYKVKISGDKLLITLGGSNSGGDDDDDDAKKSDKKKVASKATPKKRKTEKKKTTKRKSAKQVD